MSKTIESEKRKNERSPPQKRKQIRVFCNCYAFDCIYTECKIFVIDSREEKTG